MDGWMDERIDFVIAYTGFLDNFKQQLHPNQATKLMADDLVKIKKWPFIPLLKLSRSHIDWAAL